MMKSLRQLFKKKPYLAWYVADSTKLSEKSMLEHILNYGNWSDYLDTEKALGTAKIKFLFNEIVNGRRINLRPQTINYFKNYFAKYA